MDKDGMMNKELLKNLRKDVFSSLSFEEQEKTLNELVRVLRQQQQTPGISSVFGMKNDDNKLVNVNIEDIINDMGEEAFKEMLRSAIMNDGFHFSALNKNDLENLLEKAKNGELSDEDKELLEAMFLEKHEHPDHVNFSTYVILRTISGLLDDCDDEEINKDFVRNPEPFAEALLTVITASLICNKDNAVGKMFHNHGLTKALSMDVDRVPEVADLLIEYFKKEDIAPERGLLIITTVLKILVSAMHINYKNIKTEDLEEYFSDLYSAIMFSTDDNNEKLKQIINGSNNKSEDSDNKSPNGDKSESESKKVDIRKLLLDD